MKGNNSSRAGVQIPQQMSKNHLLNSSSSNSHNSCNNSMCNTSSNNKNNKRPCSRLNSRCMAAWGKLVINSQCIIIIHVATMKTISSAICRPYTRPCGLIMATESELWIPRMQTDLACLRTTRCRRRDAPLDLAIWKRETNSESGQ